MQNEFHVQSPYLKLGQNIGYLVGAIFWGVGADIWGRRSVFHRFFPKLFTMRRFFRFSFNFTLLLTGVFGTAAGASPNFLTLAALTSVYTVGLGGNLPVDSAVFLGMYYSLSEAFAAITLFAKSGK